MKTFIQKKLRFVPFSILLLTLIPSIASAQAVTTFEGLVGRVYSMLSMIVPIIISLALIVFLWGIFLLVKSNSEKGRADAINIITFGIVALFIMVSVWGFVALLSNTFFGTGALYIPQLR
jgi:uncharacterized membrane protein YozB (DUF420 family)